ncbi:MAG: ABC transporter substrate-binding protein [Acutalibacteraceae bacterium]
MKRTISVLLAALMLLAFSSCRGADKTVESTADDTSAQAVNGETTTEPPQENMIKIGVFEPQSGDDGLSGRQEILGIMYANQSSPTVKIGEKEVKIKLIYGDNGSSPEKAKTIAQALIDSGVSAVIGSYGGDVSVEAADVFSAAGVPVVAAGCTSEAVTEKGETFFRVGYTDPYQAKALASYTVKQLGIKKVYVLATLGNSASQGLSLYFREAFEALGGTVLTENFLPGTTDFSDSLKKAEKNECEAVFAPVSLVYAERIIEQSAQLDSALTYIGDSGWDSNVILKAADRAGATVYISSYYQPGANEKFENGIKTWLASNTALMNNNNNGDDTVSAACAAGFDAYKAIVKAIEKAGSAERQDITKALQSVYFPGASSFSKFSADRNAERTLAYIKTADDPKNGWTMVTEQKF